MSRRWLPVAVLALAGAACQADADGGTPVVEPMFTAAFLAERREVDLGIPQPAAVDEAGFYPTRYVIRHDADDASVRIALEEFRWREGES